MQRRPYKPIWLFLALLFAGQSLLPAAALAEISVRCVGAPASSAPCAHGMFALTDTAAITKHFAGLACCRTMADCPAMAADGCGPNSAPVPRGFSVSAAKCLVSVSLLGVKPAAVGPQVHKWLLLSAPALAPPPVRDTPSIVSASSAARFSTSPFRLPPSVSTHAHGFRAPPAA